MAWGTDFMENLTADIDKAITVDGGYNQPYSGKIGNTILVGILTVTRGSLTVENLLIR